MGSEQPNGHEDLSAFASLGARCHLGSLDPDPLLALWAVEHQADAGHAKHYRSVGRAVAVGRLHTEHCAEPYPKVKHHASLPSAPGLATERWMRGR